MISLKRLLPVILCLSVVLIVTSRAAVRGQGTGVASKVGQKLDEVGRGVGRGVKMGFDTVRSEVGRMGLHPRVYARLNWDKALNRSKIEVQIIREGVVSLRGTVPDAEAKKHAAILASETVGVNEVVDELVALAPAPAPATELPKTTTVPRATSSTATVPRLR